ncbi:hypothetical protein [Loktanella sp. S4079]|uniref:hypothetical protein n=1 Tax=Loktanella sp. S4079 TaxID=579483 RepID=UPI0005F9FE5F|nr:hypothetical protein [Loktanella sp. S4079]KJZ19870.1 hypothetical protein TW80_03040 [Loktanella sp. S4079]
MQIAYHIGAHGDDEDQLLRSAQKNVGTLSEHGIVAPGPGKYRALIRTTIQGLDGAAPAEGTRDILLDSIVEDDNITRLLLCNGNFICVANRIFEHGVFYPQAEPKARALRGLFPDDQLTLYFGLSHPATFLQEALSRPKSASLAEFMGISHPEEIDWADVVRRIHAGAPDAELVVWCSEDTPLVWPELLRHFTGLKHDVPLIDALAPLSGLIDPKVFAQLEQELTNDPGMRSEDIQTLIAECWENYAVEGADDTEIDRFEADDAMIATLTENYDADIAEIAKMDGVTLLLPFS